MSDSPPTQKHPAPRPEKDEDDSELVKTTPGTASPLVRPQKPLESAAPTGQMPLVAAEIVVERTPGMPLLTAAEPEFLGQRGPTISRPELQAAAAEKKPEVSPEGLPLLTAAQAERLPDPNAPKPAPSAPKPGPSGPRAPVPAATLPPKESQSSPQASIYEQLEAMERMEQEASRSADSAPRLVHVAPGAGKRVEISATPSGSVPAPVAPPPPAPAEFPAGMLELGTPAQSNEPLELDRSGFRGGPAPSAPRPRPSPAVERPSAPRPYVPLAPRLAMPPPPSRMRLVIWALVVAAAGSVLAPVLLDRDEPEPAVAEPGPQPAPAVISAPVAAPRAVEEGKVRFSGLPKGARVLVDGAPVEDPAAENAFPAGSHRVEVEAKGYAKNEGTIEVVAGELKDVPVALKKEKKKKRRR